MVTELSRRTSVSGPALVRLLSRLAQVDVQGPQGPLAANLNQWLGWTESIVLSTALNAAMPEPAKRGPSDDPDAEIAKAEYAQLKQSLQEAVRAALAPPAPVSDIQRRQMRGAPKTHAEVDFPSYRRRYSLVQQKMETGVAALRGRLRALLAARSDQMARLAAVDTAMEQALAEHELRLLGSVPILLERRFESLAQSGQMVASDSSAELHWLGVFRDDMRSVLLAELDFRLQPIEGLMCALGAK